MPKVEIDEEDFRRLKTLEGLTASMLKHPKAALHLENAHKLVDEKAPTPRLDRQKQEEDSLADTKKQIADLAKQLADDKAERQQSAKISEIQSKEKEGLAILKREGWTEEGLAGVKKIMDEQGILDPMIAAAYFEKLHPPAQPVQSIGTGSWNFLDMPDETNADLKKLVDSKGESNALIDKMAREALADVRGATPRR